MKIAVEGCCHGNLDAIYNQIAHLEAKNGYKVSLLLICGDFQAIRNESDLVCMSVPEKYRALGEFWKYYTGEKVAPILTIVIGGNHEASNYFWELFHGGWIAPNMYFLGNAGCVQVNGIRIAGASGIFNPSDFGQGFWEHIPFTHGSMRSIYHIREFNIRRLSLLSSHIRASPAAEGFAPSPISIFLSHDWPQNIVHHGDLSRLLRNKPFFRRDVETGKLGSPPMWELLLNLKPQWWFSAHLHVRFEAVVHHGPPPPVIADQPPEIPNPDEIAIVDSDEDDNVPAAAPVNPDEIAIDDDGQEEEDVAKQLQVRAADLLASILPSQPADTRANPDEIVLEDDLQDVAPITSTLAEPPWTQPQGKSGATSSSIPHSTTQFLALDKCLPRRQFLEIVDIPEPSPPSEPAGMPVVTFDPEWLAITRAFNLYMSTSRNQSRYPAEADARAAIAKELKWVTENVGLTKSVDECFTFTLTAPGPSPQAKAGSGNLRSPPPPKHYPNPQTAAFCTMLGIENKIDPVQ